MGMEGKKEMGQGIISVSKALFEQSKPIKDLDGRIIAEAGEPIKQPQTLTEWHTLLMLPEEYRLLEAKADAVYPLWLLTVENDAIPVVDGKLPDVTPIYCMNNDARKGYLDRIELASKVIWQRSEQ